MALSSQRKLSHRTKAYRVRFEQAAKLALSQIRDAWPSVSMSQRL
jgi:hypothetical protein